MMERAETADSDGHMPEASSETLETRAETAESEVESIQTPSLFAACREGDVQESHPSELRAAVWEFLAHTGEWEAYAPADCRKLDQLLAENPDAEHEVALGPLKWRYRVCFREGMQTNLKTGMARPVRRAAPCHLGVSSACPADCYSSSDQEADAAEASWKCERLAQRAAEDEDEVEKAIRASLREDRRATRDALQDEAELAAAIAASLEEEDAGAAPARGAAAKQRERRTLRAIREEEEEVARAIEASRKQEERRAKREAFEDEELAIAIRASLEGVEDPQPLCNQALRAPRRFSMDSPATSPREPSSDSDGRDSWILVEEPELGATEGPGGLGW